MNRTDAWYKSTDIGLLILRLFLGLRIVYGVIDNILNWDKMIEFADFLKAMHFPAPTFCAVLSVYVQFLSAVLILLGYKTRFAAGLLVINFIVALVMVHRKDSIEGMTPALAMLFISLSLIFLGAGQWSLGNRSQKLRTI